MQSLKKAGAQKPPAGGVFDGADVGRFQSGQYVMEPDPKLPLDFGRVRLSVVRRALVDLEAEYDAAAPPKALLEALCRKLELFLLDYEERDGRLRASGKEASEFHNNTAYCGVCRGMGTQHTAYCPFCGSTDGATQPPEEAEPVAAPPSSAPLAKLAIGSAEGVPEVTEGVVEVLPEEARADDGPFQAALVRLALLRANAYMNFYDIGVELRRIQEGELWKAGGYPSFQAFVDQASELSRSVAYRLIQIARDFSREDYERLGAAKLRILATLEDGAERQQLLEAARNGATSRQLQSLKEEGAGGGKAPPVEREEKQSAPPVEPTVALLGRVGGKARTLGFRTAKEDSVESAAADGAYVAVPVTEGVECHVALKLKGKVTDEVRGALAQVVGLSYRFVEAEPDDSAEG